MSNDLPLIAYIGWGSIRRIGASIAKETITKKYSGCVLIFLSGKEKWVFGEHQVELVSELVKFLHSQSSNVIENFAKGHEREVRLGSNRRRELSFGTDKKKMGKGQIYEVVLKVDDSANVTYIFLEATAQTIISVLLESIGCTVKELHDYKGLDMEQISRKAYEEINDV